MPTCHRRTFEEILRTEAPRNARTLKTKARSASWLAKVEPEYSGKFYAIKHAALKQLFRIPTHTPAIRDAWTTNHRFLLSVQLRETDAFLHAPFNTLTAELQGIHGHWIARRARGRRWQEPRRTLSPGCGLRGSERVRSLR
jgi:hypothetical protein